MYIFRGVKRQIDHQNKQLIEADEQKSKFFRFTSHELKSPVVAIKSSIDGIIKNFSGQLDDRANDLLHRASKRSDQMLEIIRELLEISKNRSRAVKDREIIEINQLILGLIQQQEVQAHEKSIILEVNLSKEDLRIYGHEDSFKEIFLNIFTNAIRYTKENGIIKIVSKDLGNNIELSIKDSGIGIKKDDIPKVFDEFFRSDNAKKEVKIGTGLGLSIVKQIVENYGGKINIQSELGEGTLFSIRFPKLKNINNDILGDQSK